jgi:hypothetical protein
MVRRARFAIVDLAEARDRQIGLKQDAEYKSKEPPKDDAGQHLGREPILYGAAGEQHSECAGDDEPSDKHAKAIDHDQQSKVDQ